MVTITSICDRLHEINGLITGCNRSRYWPDNFDNGIMPLIVPRISENSLTLEAEDITRHTRIFSLDLFLGNMMGGKPRQSMQQNAETLIDAIYSTYRPRRRLELQDNTSPLSNIKMAKLDSDTGLIMYETQGTSLAVVIFTLTVEYDATYAVY